MSFPVHALLRFSGRWFVNEEWSCGLRLITDDNSATSAQWVVAQVELLEEITPMIQAWFVASSSSISNQARLDKVELNAIGPDGKYVDPGNPNVFDFPLASAPAGSSALTTYPQLTTVLSLRTATLRGNATHGRIYPPTATTATQTGRIPPATTAAMASAFAGLCEEIALIEEIVLAGQPRVGVVSNVGEPGPSRIVTRVLVGDVVDTQRRRRGSLAEAYAEAPVEFP